MSPDHQELLSPFLLVNITGSCFVCHTKINKTDVDVTKCWATPCVERMAKRSKSSQQLFLAVFPFQDSDLKQYWMPDSQCKECYDCNEKFTTFRRRHHCRLCGQIFCSRCCNQEIPGKFMGYTGKQPRKLSNQNVLAGSDQLLISYTNNYCWIFWLSL